MHVRISTAYQGQVMSEQAEREQQLLKTMRNTLTAIIKDVTPLPGMQHPLSEQTIHTIRDCLAAIVERERDLAQYFNQQQQRPYYMDGGSAPQQVAIPEIEKKHKPH
jgi:hypothetical protein